MSNSQNYTLIRHLYTHGCEVHQIVERTKLSKIYVMHAVSTFTAADHSRHNQAKQHKGEYHFAKSSIVTGADAYADGGY